MVKISESRVLALDIIPKGIAFAVLEGPHRLYDSGVAYVSVPSKHEYVEKTESLLLRYFPDVLIVEDTEAAGFQKGPRADRVIKRLELLALAKSVPVVKVSRKEVLSVFKTKNKHETAEKVVQMFPSLKRRLPDPRRSWQSETERINIFDAAAFALTAYRKPLDLEDIPA
jgi:ribosomal protein L7Ae-like RNA K-turn-binding protein